MAARFNETPGGVMEDYQKVTLAGFFAAVAGLCIGIWAWIIQDTPWWTMAVTGSLAAFLVASYARNYLAGISTINPYYAGLACLTAAIMIWIPVTIRFECILIIIIFDVVILLLRITRGSLDQAEDNVKTRLMQPPTASKKAKTALMDGEKLLVEKRRHAIVLIPVWLAGILFHWVLIELFLGGQFSGKTLLIIWLIGETGIGIALGYFYVYRLCFTPKRIFVIRGFFTTKYPAMPLKRLTDVTPIMPWHSKLLANLRFIETAYGTLIVESAGQDQALKTVRFVPHVQAVNSRGMSGVYAT